MKQQFHLREVLTVITDLSQGGRYVKKVLELFDFLGKGSLENGRDILLKQFPQLADCEKDLSEEDIKIIKARSDQATIDAILARWINQQIAKHGEYFEVDSQ